MTEEEAKAALEKAQKENCDLRIQQREQEVRNELSEARLEEAKRIRRDRLWRDVISQFFLTVRLLACVALFAWVACELIRTADKWMARQSTQPQPPDTRFCVPPTCGSAGGAMDMRYAQCLPCKPSCQPACPLEKQECNCGDRKGSGAGGGTAGGKKKDCPSAPAAAAAKP